MDPDARISEDVRRNSERTFKTAVNVPAALPNRLHITPGIVTAIVFLIRGAKYERGIMAVEAARMIHAALMPQPEKAFAATWATMLLANSPVIVRVLIGTKEWG
jgi:hypothetical protein